MRQKLVKDILLEKRHGQMIKKYLVERRSWIGLFLCLHLLFLFVAYLDPRIPFSSILYIVFLSFIVTIIFFIIRYHKEATFYKQIQDLDDAYDMSELQRTDQPFEQIIYETLMQKMKHYKRDVDHYQIELEQEKDDILSWIHEIKTPLTTMKLMIERIEDHTLKKQLMVEWLRIDLLLDQQLHQKRISSIENDLYIESLELQPLVNKEIKHIQSWCMQKGIGFDLSFDITEVISDGKWLSFILRQLLSNAVKYSCESDIHIRSYTCNHQTKIDIIDSGRGIDPKDLSRIFDKGFTSTVDERGMASTGMGLYLARMVSETLLTQLDVQSERHVGTTFTLTFPNENELTSLRGM